MPVADMNAAREIMQDTIHTAWIAQAEPVPPMLYDNKKGEKPADGDPYAKTFIRHVDAGQVTFGGPGSRRFRKVGVITVQVFEPYGEGLTSSDQRAKIVSDALEGVSTAPDEVIFRNVRVVEVGLTGGWFQYNVVAEFEYDTIK